MMKNNITVPNTNIDVLNKIAKEYLELRYHEFNIVRETQESKEKSHFSNEYQLHQFNDLSSLNLFITYGYKEEQVFKECASFHLLNNSLIRIENIIPVKEIVTFFDNIENLDYNNFYLSKEGIHFIYIKENKQKEKIIGNENLKFKINIE